MASPHTTGRADHRLRGGPHAVRFPHGPGAACDAPSHLYCYSFAPDPGWSRRFATQPEILAYLRDCADRYGVTDRIRLRTGIVRADFDAGTGRWALRAADGAVHTADLLVSACGQLSRPAVPDIPGLDGFEGKVFHSARWDHSHDLTGRRVALVGNGASAVQIVPEIAPVTSHGLGPPRRDPGHAGPWTTDPNRLLAVCQ